MRTPSGFWLGGKRSQRDDRDHTIRAKVSLPSELPSRIDLRGNPGMPPIWDQGPVGSCEAQGGGRGLAMMYPGFMPSRLALYYAARELEGTTGQDVGVETRNMLKVLAKGAIPEDAWPYETDNVLSAPPQMDPVFRIGSYSALRTQQEVYGWLALGNPVPFAIDLPHSFEYAPNGIVMPSSNEDTIGWHCLCAVGYDADYLIFANSWGPLWGDQGYGYIPTNYVLSPNGNDAWALHTISDLAVSGPSFGGVLITGSF